MLDPVANVPTPANGSPDVTAPDIARMIPEPRSVADQLAVYDPDTDEARFHATAQSPPSWFTFVFSTNPDGHVTVPVLVARSNTNTRTSSSTIPDGAPTTRVSDPVAAAADRTEGEAIGQPSIHPGTITRRTSSPSTR